MQDPEWLQRTRVAHHGTCRDDARDRRAGKKFTCRGIARPGDPHHWWAETGLFRPLIPEWQPQDLSAALGETIRQWKALGSRS